MHISERCGHVVYKYVILSVADESLSRKPPANSSPKTVIGSACRHSLNVVVPRSLRPMASVVYFITYLPSSVVSLCLILNKQQNKVKMH